MDARMLVTAVMVGCVDGVCVYCTTRSTNRDDGHIYARNGTQRNATERNATELNSTERNGTQRNGTQRNVTERDGTERTFGGSKYSCCASMAREPNGCELTVGSLVSVGVNGLPVIGLPPRFTWIRIAKPST